MSLSKIFATFALVYGTFLAAATVAWKQPVFHLLQSEHATPVTFVLAVIFFVPFVITFTQLGLNTSEGESPSPETTQRLARLSNECPMWRVTWYGALGLISLSWLGFLIFGDRIHPFFAFSSAVSLASGLWLLFIYPTAKKLFDTPETSAHR